MDPITAAIGITSVLGRILGSGVGTSIIGALAGPKAAEAAGKVVAGAKDLFGTDDPKKIELLAQQDRTKAEILLKRLDADLDSYRIQVDDTKSARERDVAVRTVNGGTNPRANVMLVCAFTYLIIVTSGIIWFRNDIPGEVLALLNMSLGAVLGMLVQAFNFEFGSSRASGEKTKQLAEMMSNLRLG